MIIEENQPIMIEKKLIQDNGEEFKDMMGIEFILQCPYCGEMDTHTNYTDRAIEKYNVECEHCEKDFFLKFSADETPATHLEGGCLQDVNDMPQMFSVKIDVYKIYEEPTDIKKSCALSLSEDCDE